jgi:subtilisin-like proprotein convertase family protein
MILKNTFTAKQIFLFLCVMVASLTQTNLFGQGFGGCAIPSTVSPQFNSTAAVAVPDDPTAVSIINVAGLGPVLLDVNVQTFLTHTFPGDIDMTITSPAGTVVTLTTDNGAGSDNVFNGTIWNDQATSMVTTPTTAYANLVVQPTLSPEEPLAAFFGENPNGVWTIRVDDDAALDVGNLASWNLNFITALALPVQAMAMTTVTPNLPVIDVGTVNVPIVISGANNFITDVNITINIPHTAGVDLDLFLISPSGTIIQLSTDNGGESDNVFGNGTLVTLFDDDADPLSQAPFVGNTQLTNNSATDNTYVDLTVEATLTPEQALAAFWGQDPNGTWILRVTDDEAVDVGTIVSAKLAITAAVNQVCRFDPLPARALAAVPGVCGFSGLLTVPTLIGGPLCVGATVTYAIDASTTFVPAATPAMISGGAHTIKWRVTSPCGIFNGTEAVTVPPDTELPVLVGCPTPQNITVTFLPGACNAPVSFPAVTVTDNCPLSGISITNQAFGTQPAGWATTTTGPGVAPAGLFNWAATASPGGSVNAMMTAPFVFINDDAAGAAFQPAISTVTSQTYNLSGFTGVVLSFNWVNDAFVGNGNMLAQVSGDGGTTWTMLPGFPILDDATGNVVYNVPANLTTANFKFRFSYDDENDWGWGCGIDNFKLVGNAVGVTTSVNAAAATPGGAFSANLPLGVTNVLYTATDVAGNTSTCTAKITVLPFVGGSTLVCTDNVNISLDQNCQYTVGAADILVGTNYGCFNDYVVALDKVAPYGDGPWIMPATLTKADVGKTYGVKVTDNVSGNSCWGLINVEDKLAPVLNCVNATYPCNQNTVPGSGTPLEIAFAPAIPISAGNAASTAIANLVVSSTATVQDLSITLDINHTWVGDLSATLTSPAGTVVQLFSQPGVPATAFGCANDNILVTMSDAASNTAAAFESTCNASTTAATNAISGNFQPINPLSAFNGQPIAGTWILTVTDPGAGDGGNIVGVTLSQSTGGSVAFPNGLALGPNVVLTGPKTYRVTAGTGAPVLESCSNTTLSYIDTKAPQNCASGLSEIITRKWTAVDASGNSSTCVQTLSLERPTLADVVLPPNYDDIDEPAFTCGSATPGAAGLTPEWISAQPNLVTVVNTTDKLQGTPLVANQPDGCNIGWAYADVTIPVCEGTYKVRRKWTIIDWCTGAEIEHSQLIKVVDKVGPTWTCPANLTVSTNPDGCCAIADLPNTFVTDNCSSVDGATVSAMIVSRNANNEIVAMNEVVGSANNTFPGANAWDRTYQIVFGASPCLPVGKHTITYSVEDKCGNLSSCEFELTVLDLTPPEMVCTEFTVVSMGYDDPEDCYWPNPAACTFAGQIWIDAEFFNQNSSDNCSNIFYTIRRMPTDTIQVGTQTRISYSPFIDGLSGSADLTGNCNNPFDPTWVDYVQHPDEYELATGLTRYRLPGSNPPAISPTLPNNFPTYNSTNHGFRYQVKPAVNFAGAVSTQNFPILGRDSIKFYCNEVGTTQTVILRGYQLDNLGRIQLDANGEPIYGECMVQVQIQDKVKPTCIPPVNVTVSCEAFDPSLWAYGVPTVADNCCLDITKVTTFGTSSYKGWTQSANYAQFDQTCNRGVITRTFVSYDCSGNTSTCTQKVTVTYNQNYQITWPNDVDVTACNGNSPFGAPIITGKDCELTGVSYTDETFTIVNDACRKIERTWTIINWCSYNSNVVCEQINNPVGLNTGPTTPVLNNDMVCKTYKQIIKIKDATAPIADEPVAVECDYSANNELLWNNAAFYDGLHFSHDLCEGGDEISITANDDCSKTDITIRALVFMDLDNNSVMETVYNTNDLTPPPAGSIRINNANNVNFGGGTVVPFDNRSVSAAQKYVIALENTIVGTKKKATLRYNSAGTWSNPQLPYGNYKIKWIVSDGCGNETVKEDLFIIKDCKKPTVVCRNGLSANLMNNGTGAVTLWATDFLQYAEDNCTPPITEPYNVVNTPADLLTYAIIRVDDPAANGSFPTGRNTVTFDCNSQGYKFVQLWAMDKAGNADFCEAAISVQDNMNVCPNNSNKTIAGVLATETAQGLEEGNVQLNGTNPVLPPISMFQTSTQTGHYQFSQVMPILSNYTVTPEKDDNHLNGVTTFDLLLMSKHILGISPLATPYKMIAADVNKSGSITTFDIVELRKLVLGIYNELPNNTSWRFVDKSFVFADQSNPFATQFPEFKTVASIQTDAMNDDFVAVKIGDVSGDATANNLMTSDDRTTGTLMFDVEDRFVKTGETFTVNFKATEKVLGYQFTMKHNNLEVVDLVPGKKMSKENFAVFAAENILTTSFDGTEQAEFGVTFRAKANGQLSQMLNVSSQITKAEAYSQEATRYEVAFRFNGTEGSTISGVGFEVYQNQPNPFINKTVIGFHLPEATEAKLTVYDETGRTLFIKKGEFAKGDNAITIDRSLLNTTGVMFYKVETSKESASKKMIQTK